MSTFFFFMYDFCTFLLLIYGLNETIGLIFKITGIIVLSSLKFPLQAMSLEVEIWDQTFHQQHL